MIWTILPHLLRPLKGGAPSLIVIFSIGLVLAGSAGLLGLALGLILLSWYSKYAFILFDHAVSGVDEPPALDIQMINPVDEQRPLALLCILGGMYWICHALSVYVADWAGTIVGAVFLFCVPASAAVLGLECNALKALNPVAWFRIVAALRGLYLLLIGLITLYIFLIMLISRLDLWNVVQLILIQFCGLSIFSVLAGFLYERRNELGMEVTHSPERTRDRQVAQDMSLAAKTIDIAYGQVRSGQHVQAWDTLSQWLESRGHNLQDYEWLTTRVADWNDRRYQTRLTEEYIDRLLAANRTGAALTVVNAALQRDMQFRPKSAQSTLRLAHIAASGGAPKTARTLLTDFATRFNGSAEIRAAETLAQRLAQ